MKGLQKSFKMVLDSSLYDLSYHSYVCQSTANIVKISPKLRFLDDHNSKNTRLMWLKLGVAKLLYICIDLTKFKENPEGLSFFCVDLTWNDPNAKWRLDAWEFEYLPFLAFAWRRSEELESYDVL